MSKYQKASKTLVMLVFGFCSFSVDFKCFHMFSLYLTIYFVHLFGGSPQRLHPPAAAPAPPSHCVPASLEVWTTVGPNSAALCVFPQRCHPGREDLRHRGHREQRGSGAGQHGDLWPLHQHMDAAAVAALPALPARLRGHQEVHPERLRATAASQRHLQVGRGVD